jgi:transcriptional regulator with XRE-family HTH domain
MSEEDHQPSVIPSFRVGQKVLALRLAQGLSQRELARHAGITNANLSMIEQGRVSPSVATLEKILLALDVSLPEFFSEGDDPSSGIQRKGEQTYLRRAGSEYRILSSSNSETFPALACQTLSPGATCVGIWSGRRHWVSGMVVEGELHLWLDGTRHQLAPGDGFQFHLKRPHQFVNDTAQPVVVMLAVSDTEEP